MRRARILICRQFGGRAVDDENLFQFGEQQHAACWRFCSRSQQSVVAPGIHADGCGGGESAKAIGFQPLFLGVHFGKLAKQFQQRCTFVSDWDGSVASVQILGGINSQSAMNGCVKIRYAYGFPDWFDA